MLGLWLAGHPAAGGVLDDGTGLGEFPQHFGHEEGVAVGLPVDLMGERHPGVVELVAGGGLQEGHHVGVVEALEHEGRHPGRFAEQCPERLGQRVRGRELGVAVGADHQQPGGGRVGHHVAEQLEAGLVGPVQVVEEHHDRVLGARRIEEGHGGGVEEVALGVGVGALGGRQAPESLAEGGHHPGQLTPVGGHMGTQHHLGGVGHQVTERLGEGPVGGTQLLVATPEQHCCLAYVGAAGQFGDHGGLALPRLARDQHQLTTRAGGHPFERALEQLELLVPADHAHPGAVRQAGRQRDGSARLCVDILGLPGHLEGLDRFGQALQLDLAQRREGVVRAPAGCGAHQVGHQDLSGAGLGAQSSSLDDRVTEVVVGFLGGLPGAHSDPDAQRALDPGVVPVDDLLHGHRTAQRRRGRREGPP